MAHSGEVWVLNKIAELANRCGLSPVEADVEINLHFPEAGGYYYSLHGMDNGAATPADEEKFEKFWQLLGLDESGLGRAETLSEIEATVDRALSLLPRPRFR